MELGLAWSVYYRALGNLKDSWMDDFSIIPPAKKRGVISKGEGQNASRID